MSKGSSGSGMLELLLHFSFISFAVCNLPLSGHNWNTAKKAYLAYTLPASQQISLLQNRQADWARDQEHNPSDFQRNHRNWTALQLAGCHWA